MEQIAPLARILAEANGIDWQQLRGSGADGTVVEQDILNYLSRIMSGEEEPPSTPVDETPEGWTGDEQLPAGMFSADMLSQAGIDSDIADFVTQSRSPQVPATPPAPRLAHDAADFELDDDPGDLDAPLAAEPQPVAGGWSWNPAPAQTAAQTTAQTMAQPADAQPADAPAPALQITAALAAEPEPAFPSLGVPQVPVVPEIVVPEVSVPAAGAQAGGMAAMGLGGLLSRLYRKDKETGAEEHAAPQFTPQPTSTPITSASATPVHGEAPELAAPEVTDVYAAEQHAEEAAPAAVAAPEIAVSEVAVPELDAPELEMQVPLGDAAEPEAAPQPQPVAAQAVSPDRPADAVWFGTYLRRDARVGAADDLRAQLSEALGQDVSLAFLVARAAERHADALGLELGRVALRGADGQDQTVTGGALRDAVNARHDSQASDGQHSDGQASAPDLLVTDAGALGADDLHYPHTLTLSLGRTQEGRAALSLNGDVDPRQAAQFLGRVAEALEKPIALVL